MQTSLLDATIKTIFILSMSRRDTIQTKFYIETRQRYFILGCIYFTMNEAMTVLNTFMGVIMI